MEDHNDKGAYAGDTMIIRAGKPPDGLLPRESADASRERPGVHISAGRHGCAQRRLRVTQFGGEVGE